MKAPATALIGCLAIWMAMTRCALASEIPSRRPQSPILFQDVTSQTGVHFRHCDGSSGKYYIVEYVSSGLALLDYDNDGLLDIYFLSGSALGKPVKRPPANALYRNGGGWRFTDVTEASGVGDAGHGLGVAAADYDNDGDQDLYVNNYGPNVLYRNDGNGTFTDVTAEAGVENGRRVGAGVCFLDADRDGDLDLYVSNYVKFSQEQHVPVTLRGLSAYPSPVGYEPDPDTLFRNRGDGTFSDASVLSGIGLHPGPGMGTVCADYDNDGDTDIFVCNDLSENFLFENDGSGRFEEVGLFLGAALDIGGNAQGSMGVDCGDYDNDGWLDFFMTNYQGEMPVLYRNSGNRYLDDVTYRCGAGSSAIPQVTWGTGFVDFDNDGDRDLFIACGHLEDNIELKDDTAQYETRNILLLNTGDGKFVDVSRTAGDGIQVERSSRGAAFGDLDNDGDIDVVVLNSRRRPTILRNDSRARKHWIQIRLRGVKANRDGVGARVDVIAGDLAQVAEVHSGRGYQSHYGMRLHFGLGRRDHIDRIFVRWIGGGVDVFEQIDADQTVILEEGAGKLRPTAAPAKARHGSARS